MHHSYQICINRMKLYRAIPSNNCIMGIGEKWTKGYLLNLILVLVSVLLCLAISRLCWMIYRHLSWSIGHVHELDATLYWKTWLVWTFISCWYLAVASIFPIYFGFRTLFVSRSYVAKPIYLFSLIAIDPFKINIYYKQCQHKYKYIVNININMLLTDILLFIYLYLY